MSVPATPVALRRTCSIVTMPSVSGRSPTSLSARYSRMQCQQCGCEGAESAWLSTIVGLHPGAAVMISPRCHAELTAEFVREVERPFQTVTAAEWPRACAYSRDFHEI